jgi:hypothetical protein
MTIKDPNESARAEWRKLAAEGNRAGAAAHLLKHHVDVEPTEEPVSLEALSPELRAVALAAGDSPAAQLAALRAADPAIEKNYLRVVWRLTRAAGNKAEAARILTKNAQALKGVG